MAIENIRFSELDCVRLSNGTVTVLVTQSVGPRIISYSLQQAESLQQDDGNIFVVSPDLKLNCPGAGDLYLWGGHRLWHAPEVPQRTYLPDNRPVEVTAADHQDGQPPIITVTQPTENETGLQKKLRIELPDDSSTVYVDHTIMNHGLFPIECVPWAITQMKPGGLAILPQPTELADSDGVLPNRQMALWPYTDMKSPHIQWGNRYHYISAAMETGALKIGFPNPKGWLAYFLDGDLFVKQANFYPDESYYDYGSSSQCYCNPLFLELETLGPIATIEPGGSISHREVWNLFSDVRLDPTGDAVEAIINAGG